MHSPRDTQHVCETTQFCVTPDVAQSCVTGSASPRPVVGRASSQHKTGCLLSMTWGHINSSSAPLGVSPRSHLCAQTARQRETAAINFRNHECVCVCNRKSQTCTSETVSCPLPSPPRTPAGCGGREAGARRDDQERGGARFRLCALTAGAQVPSLLRELRVRMGGAAKKKGWGAGGFFHQSLRGGCER